jgi:RNA polymerase sigma-70 factor (ECF subfamily)
MEGGVIMEDIESELLTKAQNDDSKAMGEIYVRYNKRLLAYFHRKVRAFAYYGLLDPEDLAQDTWIRVLNSLKNYRKGKSEFSFWLFLTARGVFYNALRKVGRTILVFDHRLDICVDEDELGSLSKQIYHSDDPAKYLELRELWKITFEVIRSLDDIYRAPLLLYHIERHSIKEIAALLGLTLGAVRVRLHRARKKVKEDVEEQLGELEVI